jgi:methyl-accepting chemotaxis protein
MELLFQQMSDIQNSSQRLQAIEQIIEDISDKNNVINSIVFKTQLLSFNASIEAARAGDYGKGFSVVAEEVGALADLSGKAALEIGQLLDKSRQSVKEILGEIKTKVESSHHVANDAQKAFVDIAIQVDSLCAEMSLISEATQQQEVGLQQVDASMKQMNTAATSNTAATDAARASAMELFDHCGHLKLLSNDLSELVTGNKKVAVNSMTHSELTPVDHKRVGEVRLSS